ncbi:MAG: hypothetical protein LBH55_04440, partial [Mycoplasmataceae bacterium]|nr:hypothetical protein [Mycoplasmataceae bacterium]
MRWYTDNKLKYNIMDIIALIVAVGIVGYILVFDLKETIIDDDYLESTTFVDYYSPYNDDII